MSTGALPSAAVPLEEIVATDPSTALYMPLAERLLSRGLVSDAIRLCEERRTRAGRGVGDHIVLGRCYLADGRLVEACEQFQAALALDRENVVALKSMAGILSHEGRHAEAGDLYRAVCRVDPGDLESQSALHQITSGDYPEVRPPEVIVSQSDLTWQPIRLSREEDHLSELGLGLRTLESIDTGPLRPSLPADGIGAAATAGSGSEARRPLEAEDLILTPEELSTGPHFPREPEAETPEGPAKPPKRPEVVVPAGAAPTGGLHNRLGSLDVQEFKVSALERVEDALRAVEVRALGEVETPEPPPAATPEVEPDPEPRTAPTRSAVWDERPERAAPSEPASPPAGPEDEGAARPVVEGNRSAFETWLGRLGGK